MADYLRHFELHKMPLIMTGSQILGFKPMIFYTAFQLFGFEHLEDDQKVPGII